MTEATVSFAGNLTDDPEVGDTRGERRSVVREQGLGARLGAVRPC
jgi:hypothetical protein